MATLRLLLAPPHYNLRPFHKQILLHCLLLIRLRCINDSITKSASNWEKRAEGNPAYMAVEVQHLTPAGSYIHTTNNFHSAQGLKKVKQLLSFYFSSYGITRSRE
jgi:hypothetical protein